MAEIRGFVAPVRPLRVAEGGFSAFQTTGRRIGLDYRSVAEDYSRIGQAEARTIDAQRWPFDILELIDRGRTTAGGGGGGLRVRGSGGAAPWDWRGHNAVLAGGAALGDYLGGQNGIPKHVGGELVDVVGGTTMIGNKVFQGTFDPTRLHTPSGNDTLGTSPTVGIPEGVDPDFYLRQTGQQLGPNDITVQPLPGSVPADWTPQQDVWVPNKASPMGGAMETHPATGDTPAYGDSGGISGAVSNAWKGLSNFLGGGDSSTDTGASSTDFSGAF